MKLLLILSVMVLATACDLFSSPKPEASPTAAANPPKCEQLAEGKGVNCTYADGSVTHHSTCEKCGKSE